MIRGGLLALALILPWAVAACSSPGEAAPSPATESREPASEAASDIAILCERARAAVARATSGVRADLSAMDAAEQSLRDDAAGLRARLTALRELAIDEGVDAAESQVETFLDRLARLEERSAAVAAALDEVRQRLEAFEEWADDVVRQALTDESALDFHRDQLLDVEAEAEDLTRDIVLAPRVRASDRLAREVALLSTEVERAGVTLDAEVARRRAAALAAQQARDQAVAARAEREAPPPLPAPAVSDEVVELQTTQGTLVLELFDEVAPQHVANFRKLVRERFYDGLTFHRVVPGYLAQAGCPLGNGSGGPGYQIPAEFSARRHVRGTLSMARLAHPDSAGSQFFLCLADLPGLDGKYTIFGRLLRGADTLAAIEALGSESGKPTATIQIQRAVLRKRRADDGGGVADARPGG